MGAIASQITSLTIVSSVVYSGADQRKHQSSASQAFVRGIHRGPVNSPHKWPVTRKMFPFDDVIMPWCSCTLFCSDYFVSSVWGPCNLFNSLRLRQNRRWDNSRFSVLKISSVTIVTSRRWQKVAHNRLIENCPAVCTRVWQQLHQDCPELTSIPYTLLKIVSLESFSEAMFAFQHTKYIAHKKARSI